MRLTDHSVERFVLMGDRWLDDRWSFAALTFGDAIHLLKHAQKEPGRLPRLFAFRIVR